MSFFEYSKFDFVFRLYETLNNKDGLSPTEEFLQLRKIITRFKEATSNSIFETRQIILEEFKKSLGNPEQELELGRNEILHFRAIMMTQMAEMIELVIHTLKSTLEKELEQQKFLFEFYSDLSTHLNASKNIFGEKNIKTSDEKVEFFTNFPILINNISLETLNATNQQNQGKFVYTYRLPTENIDYIKKQEDIYMQSALGMGRMLQRSNLNLFFRKPVLKLQEN